MCSVERVNITLTRGVKFKRVNFTLEKEWFCTFLSHPSFGVNLIVQLLSSKIVHFDDKRMKLCQFTIIPKTIIL